MNLVVCDQQNSLLGTYLRIISPILFSFPGLIVPRYSLWLVISGRQVLITSHSRYLYLPMPFYEMNATLVRYSYTILPITNFVGYQERTDSFPSRSGTAQARKAYLLHADRATVKQFGAPAVIELAAASPCLGASHSTTITEATANFVRQDLGRHLILTFWEVCMRRCCALARYTLNVCQRLRVGRRPGRHTTKFFTTSIH